MITNKERVKILRRIQRLVNGRYTARARFSDFADPMLVFVATALSPNPFHPGSKKVFKDLTRSFVDWNEARVTRNAEMAECLTPHGFPAARATDLKKRLSGLFDHFNGVNLDFIESLDPNPIRAKLQIIKSLQPEDIDTLLLLHRSVHVMPISAPISRILQRIGVVKKDASTASTQSLLKSAVGRDGTLTLFENFNTLADKICTPTAPACDSCVLKNECLHGLVKRKIIKEKDAEFPIVIPDKPVQKAAAKKKPAAKTPAKKKLTTQKKPTAKKPAIKKAATKKKSTEKKTATKKKPAARKKEPARKR